MASMDASAEAEMLLQRTTELEVQYASHMEEQHTKRAWAAVHEQHAGLQKLQDQLDSWTAAQRKAQDAAATSPPGVNPRRRGRRGMGTFPGGSPKFLTGQLEGGDS